MKLIMCQYTSFLALLLAIAMLLSACSNDDDNSPADTSTDPSEIRMNADVWQMPEGTRATFYGTGTLASGSFTASAYLANSTTSYISPVQVNWDSTNNKWVFSDGKHYWPASEALDFFAYMPAILPSFITNNSDVALSVTYVARNPQFKCKNLPMTYNPSNYTANQGDGLQEVVFAMKTGQNKADHGADGVTLSFCRPFTRIKMQLSAAQKEITINSITFKGLKNNGSCSFAYNGSTSKWEYTWTPSGDATDLVVTLGHTFSATGEVQEMGVPYMMIPQDWAGNITVNATWIDWGEEFAHDVSTKLDAVTWQPGTSYTYTFTITETDLRVDTEKFTEQW